MLNARIIRPSSLQIIGHPSPQSRRKVASRIDCRALDHNTTKDKFSIPLINDLLDELYDTKYFSNMDLRYGYYQVRKQLKIYQKPD